MEKKDAEAAKILLNDLKQSSTFSIDLIAIKFGSLVDKISKLQSKYQNIVISGARNLIDEFSHAHAVVGHNSSPTVASVIEGIPTLVTDPDRAQINGVNQKKWEDLDSPTPYDRELWIRRLAQTHWTLDEVKAGLAWKHLRKYVK